MDEASLGRFRDQRRAAVGAALPNAVQNKQTLCIHRLYSHRLCIHRLAESRNQTLQFNNFLANPAVSTHEMLVTAGRQTNRRAPPRWPCASARSA